MTRICTSSRERCTRDQNLNIIRLPATTRLEISRHLSKEGRLRQILRLFGLATTSPQRPPLSRERRIQYPSSIFRRTERSIQRRLRLEIIRRGTVVAIQDDDLGSALRSRMPHCRQIHLQTDTDVGGKSTRHQRKRNWCDNPP